MTPCVDSVQRCTYWTACAKSRAVAPSPSDASIIRRANS
nr:MAG TPA: hypothetical protein [Bacteriophage sp.]